MKIKRTEERLVLELDELLDYPKAAQEILDWIGKDIRILLLTGDLGAGKTTLAKAICQKLGVQQAVTSPTYAIVNEYARAGGQELVYHLDLYRLNDLEEALHIGIEEYLDSNNYC
ncbi:MAG: tRNA (adenosine(37)-N6)-threonylcarbamoyltransferase complex ATPase subunit type 1 TsaE, partial [Bacteroidota bacterium]